MRLLIDANVVLDVLDKLRLIFRFTDFTAADLEKAADMGWDDFEDAIQAATAERIMADRIITRNIRDFRNSKVIAFTSSELIAQL